MVLVSLVSLIGVVTLYWKKEAVKKYVFVLVSLAVGALLGDAFIHLIPEAFESSINPTLISILIIAGVLVFFVLEKFLHWHHHEGIDDHEHDKHQISHVGKMVLISDGLHNLIDGLIIGASYLVSIEVGIATTIAVVLHEIPQEIGDFGVLLHAGYTKSRALFLNFISALLAIGGAVIALVLGKSAENFSLYFLPIAAGGFIYIALADLIPELHKTKRIKHSVIQLISVAVGVVLMILLLSLE